MDLPDLTIWGLLLALLIAVRKMFRNPIKIFANGQDNVFSELTLQMILLQKYFFVVRQAHHERKN